MVGSQQAACGQTDQGWPNDTLRHGEGRIRQCIVPQCRPTTETGAAVNRTAFHQPAPEEKRQGMGELQKPGAFAQTQVRWLDHVRKARRDATETPEGGHCFAGRKPKIGAEIDASEDLRATFQSGIPAGEVIWTMTAKPRMPHCLKCAVTRSTMPASSTSRPSLTSGRAFRRLASILSLIWRADSTNGFPQLPI